MAYFNQFPQPHENAENSPCGSLREKLYQISDLLLLPFLWDISPRSPSCVCSLPVSSSRFV